MEFEKRLRENLIKSGLLGAARLHQLSEAGTLEDGLISVIFQEKLIPPEKFKEFLREYYMIDSCTLNELSISREAIELLDYPGALKYHAVAYEIKGGELYVATSNPFDTEALDDLALITGREIKLLFAEPFEIEKKIDDLYASGKLNSLESEFIGRELNGAAEVSARDSSEKDFELRQSPVVKLLDSLLYSASSAGASDIHIEAAENSTRIRFRIDGALITHENLDKRIHASLISRIKIVGGMDISERRQAQDGHASIERENDKIDLRISVIPSLYGEKAVIRLIYSDRSLIAWDRLGFRERELEMIEKLLQSSQGAILVTGPTGSGKTTTLASFVHKLNRDDINIVTVEDPVEHVIKGTTQIPINPKAGLNFPNALRSILRQDPDVIMIGEIRDTETAEIAVRASLTGHLVLSTLHTNSAKAAVFRLIDMGIEHYLLPAAISGVISQRLLKRICENCKTGYIIPPADSAALAIPEGAAVFRGTGCARCNFSGYKGRFAVCEILPVDYRFREALEDKSPRLMNEYCKEIGMITLKDAIISHVLEGNTTVEELYKTIYGSEGQRCLYTNIKQGIKTGLC